MFEAEVEMERRSSFMPLILMACLAAMLIGLVAYVILQVRERTPLTADQAKTVVASVLRAQGPATVKFRTGIVEPVEDRFADPNYRLLEKAGLVTLAKTPHGARVTLTGAGERLLGSLPECKKSPKDDGFQYEAPVAGKEFLSIASVEMTGTDTASVAYNWKWVPNPLGDVFDAGGPLVKSFGVWERQNLINKFGAAFYHGDSNRSSVTLARKDGQWKVATRSY